jgi:hypothetical protein
MRFSVALHTHGRCTDEPGDDNEFPNFALVDVAWFDEVLFSETNGRIRGTGVLTRQSGQWKLEHYAMSFLIFNENWDEVIELTRKTKALKESGPNR